ncbi:MAG: FtsX-like permease family protein [Candidatus Baldrarchaeia archaeon]
MGLLKIAIRNVKRRKIRSAIAVLGVVLAVSLIIAVNVVVDSLTVGLVEAYTGYLGGYDAFITRRGDFGVFNSSVLIENISRIEDVNLTVPIFLYRCVAYSIYGKKVGVAVLGLNHTCGVSVLGAEIIEGSFLSSSNACILPKDLAADLRVSVGDSLLLEVFSFKSMRYENVTVTVAGIISTPEGMPITLRRFVLLDVSFLQNMTGVLWGDANIILVRFDQSIIDYDNIDATVAHMVDIGCKIQDTIGFNFSVHLIKASLLENIKDAIAMQRAIFLTFTMISVIMAIILVMSTMLMNITERVREIGIIRSLGATKSQIFAMVLMESLILGVIGTMIGLAAGLMVSRVLVQPIVSNGMITVQITFRYYHLLYGGVLGVLISSMGGIYPAYSASRITPVEALSPSARRATITEEEFKRRKKDVNISLLLGGISLFALMSFLIFFIPIVTFYGTPIIFMLLIFVSLGSVLLGLTLVMVAILPLMVTGIAKLLRKIWKVEALISGRNLLRYGRRTKITFFMLSMSIAFILLIGNITTISLATSEVSMRAHIGSDIVIYPRQPVHLTVCNNISELEGVVSVCPITSPLTVKAGDIVLYRQTTINIYGVNTSTFLESAFREFVSINGISPEDAMERLQENGTIIISEGLAKFLGVGVGDTIRIEISQKTITLKVIATASMMPGFSFTKFEQKASGTDAIVSLQTFKNISGTLTVERILVKVKEGVDPRSVASSISNTIGVYYDIEVVTLSDLMESMRKGYEQMFALFTSILVFAVVIAVLGHAISIITSIEERIWEIGVIRSIGMQNFQIIMSAVLEAFILAVCSYLAGMVGSLVITAEFVLTNNLTSDLPMPFTLPCALYIGIFLLVSVTAVILSAILSRKVTKMSIIDALRRGMRL